MKVEFDVVGLPAPQGSKTRMPNGALVEGRSRGQRERHSSWRDSVTAAARTVADDLPAPIDEAIHVTVVFRFPMPKARRKADRERGWRFKTSAPDADKLQRSTGDALQAAGLISDDARIAQWSVSKIEVVGWTGATLRLEAAS